MENPLIVLGLPSAGKVETITCQCFAALTLYVASSFRPPLICAPTGRIEQNRNSIVNAAQENRADYLMFIDADMVFGPSVMNSLLSHNVDIVGCNAAGRVSGKPVFDYKGEGLKEVQSIGMALTLINMKVFNEMEKPWFYSPPLGDGTINLMSSDINFCLNAKKTGFKVFCDLDLSKEIGHLATIERKLKG